MFFQVGQAHAEVNEASAQVAKAYDQIQLIIAELSSTASINNVDLDDLERRLSEAEAEINQAALQLRLESLKEHKAYQNKAIAEHKAEVEFLENEVENIRRIADALPIGCFKAQRLEV